MENKPNQRGGFDWDWQDVGDSVLDALRVWGSIELEDYRNRRLGRPPAYDQAAVAHMAQDKREQQGEPADTYAASSFLSKRSGLGVSNGVALAIAGGLGLALVLALK